MDLLTFEQKLDATIMRKRLEIQEAIRRPMKQKRKVRVFISHQFIPGETEVSNTAVPLVLVNLDINYNDWQVVPKWELKVEGRLLDEVLLLII